MLDGFRFHFGNKKIFENGLLKEGVFDFNGRYSITTGEVLEYPKITNWQGLEVHINNGSAYIKGSLHKFYNRIYHNQNQNYDDFSLKKIKKTIDLLNYQFGEEIINNSSVNKLEIGFNINISEIPKELIEHKIIMYNFKGQNHLDEFGGLGFEKEFWKGDYIWKIYDKGMQYDIAKNRILRMELKIINPRVIQRHGISNPSDLKIEDNLKQLFAFFINEFENLLIIDNLGEDLSSEIRQSLLKYSNPNYWLELKKNKVTNRIVSKRKEITIELIEKYELNKTKNELRKLLTNKFATLLTT